MELVILCGLQASGKTTFRLERFFAHVVISKDLMRNNRRREQRQRELLSAALAAGDSVVVDNTNPSPEERVPLIGIGRQAGAVVLGYYFDAHFEECVERNARRSGRAVVPHVGLVDVARRLRRPTMAEGFDGLWLVRARQGDFEVEGITSGPTMNNDQFDALQRSREWFHGAAPPARCLGGRTRGRPKLHEVHRKRVRQAL